MASAPRATARRVLANQRRSTRRRRALQERLASEAVTASRAPSSSGREGELVHEALRRLEPRDRETLLLAEWEGLSPAQIAGVLGCLSVTVRGRLHRARRRFRAVFAELVAADDSRASRRESSVRRDELVPRHRAPAVAAGVTTSIREGSC